MRQQENRPYDEKTERYIDGNTVKRLHEENRRRSEQIHEEYVRKQEQEEKRRERQKKARDAARRNQELSLQMNLGYVLFLVFAMTVLAVVFGCYLLNAVRIKWLHQTGNSAGNGGIESEK